MVEQPSNKQVEQRKETSATARRRSPPAPRLPSPSTTPATYTVALESVSEALDGLRNHARAGRTGCAQGPRRLDFAPPLRGQGNFAGFLEFASDFAPDQLSERERFLKTNKKSRLSQ